jgi:GMP synthase-like glutamine amidotransferase
MTKVGILRTGEPPAHLIPRFGHSDDMFRALLGGGFDVTKYDVVAGQWPEQPSEQDAWLITGSRAGVYDKLPWIDPLKRFLRDVRGRARLVGICFGHQIMAEAFGGKVEKSARGWGAGLHRYRVFETAPWMDGDADVSIPVSHQDQIVIQPPSSRILAGSDFSPFGILAYDDQPAISFQPHPEFDPAYARELIEARRDFLPDPDGAIASLGLPNDRARVAGWIREFLRTERP